MSLDKHTTPDSLEQYSFIWILLMLVLTAISLLVEATPIVNTIFESSSVLYGPISALLNLSWIISGFVSLYLMYRWNTGGKTLFGGKDKKDLYAFLITIVTGLNIGFMGLFDKNILMDLFYSSALYSIAGIIYLIVVFQLYTSWNKNNKKVFPVSEPKKAEPAEKAKEERPDSE